MKKALLLFVISLSTIAQVPQFDFLNVKQFGDGEGLNNEVINILPYHNGDILTTGQFRGLIDFDLDPFNNVFGFNARPSGGQFIARYSQTGNLRWMKPLYSPSGVSIRDIIMDGDQNIFITGSFQPEIIFDADGPNPQTFVGTSPNNANGYLAKLDTVGNLLWVKFFMGNSIETGMKLQLNQMGQIILLGHASQTVVFDPVAPNATLVSAGAGDVFVAAYNQSNGDFHWLTQIPGNGFDNARSLVLDSQDNIYFVGDFTSTLVFPTVPLPTPTPSTGGNDLFLAKLSPTGSFLWGRKIGGTSTDLGADLKIAGDTLLLLNGTFRFNMQFDHGGSTPSFTGPNNTTNIFLAAYDTSGAYHWNVRIGSTANDVTNQLVVDSTTSRVWLSGSFRNHGDVDPGPDSALVNFNTAGNPFVAAYTLSDGSFSEYFAPESDAYAEYQALGLAADGSLWAGGRFQSAVRVAPGSTTVLTTPRSNIQAAIWARYSTNLDTAWTVDTRSGGDDEIVKVRHDANGNIFVAGNFQGQINMDPNGSAPHFITAYDDVDGFLASYTPAGVLRWVTVLGGTGEDAITAMELDHAGNVLVGGYFLDAFYFPTANGFDTITAFPTGLFSPRDVFMTKFDNAGNPLFGYRIGGSNTDNVFDIAVYPNNDYLIGGSFQGGFDFDPALAGQNTFTGNNTVGYFAKYNAQGVYQWNKLINGSSNQAVTAVTLDDSLNIFATGSYRNTTNFDLPNTFNLTSNFGGDDFFLAKYTEVGNLSWVKGIGGNQFERGFDVITDENGNVYATGIFGEVAVFEPSVPPLTLTSNGSVDVFLISYNAQGNLRWVAPFGGVGYDAPRELLQIGDKIVSTGYFRDTVDFDPSINVAQRVSFSGDDVYVHVLDTVGNFITVVTFESLGDAQGNTLSHRAGNTYLGGFFRNTMDANPGGLTFPIQALGGKDAFLLELGNAGPCPTEYDTITTSNCGPFAWGNEVFDTSGTYVRNLFTTNGCDSVVTLNLEIFPIFDSVVQVIACDSYVWNGLTLSQSGLFFDSLQTVAGCDSIITLDLTINTLTNSTQTEVACETFTWTINNQVYTQTGVYSDTLVNAAGCDSIITLDLTINTPTNSTQTEVACETFTWAINNQVYTQTGVYSDTLVNAAGCDSIVTLDLVIDTVNVGVQIQGVVLIADAVGAAYQWLDCNANDAPILGATQQSFTAPTNGSFAVAVTENNCTDTSLCVVVADFSAGESLSGGASVFPNPNAGNFTLTLPSAVSDLTLEVYDMAGKQCYSGTEKGKSEVFIHLDVASGVYLLLYHSAQYTGQKRIIIQ
ncbi:MAG: T9SS type A sorting domain-containing protein [Schleiferiaceae bacterium]|nr:T9SS type A sorting domain-containing protein [Schleiferiaceae bacterium]